jgi:predicted acetyltransferase
MPIDVRPRAHDHLEELMVPLSTAFGMAPSPERVARARSLPELEVLFGAHDGGAVVGCGGAYTFGMTVPGGVAVETSGLTLVAVLPTHRRRGILRAMMRHHLDQAHARGQVLAALYASEGSIYGRFGYGMAALRGEMEIRKERAVFSRPSSDLAAGARVRLVSEEEAASTFPLVHERLRLARPGMLTRSDAWWRVRRTSDPEWLRAGRPPLQRVLLEIGGRPAGYALYRFGAAVFSTEKPIPIEVVECLADSLAATRALWTYLFSIDIVESFHASLVPPDHPLLFLIAEPGRLNLRLVDGLWVRLVDVGAALSQRGYPAAASREPLVIEVVDAFCPWNAGRYRLVDGAAARTDEPAEVVVDVDALGAAYLGSFSFSQLALGGRVTELRGGALERADGLFRAGLQPWCLEIF